MNPESAIEYDEFTSDAANFVNPILFRKSTNTAIEKPLRIGFSGAHRTGKTTLAKSLADKLDIPFLDMSVGTNPVWKLIESHDTVTFAERLTIQKRILEEMKRQLGRMNSRDSFVTDRTLIDVVAYLLCNIDSTTSRLFDEDVSYLIEECNTLTLKYFDFIFVVQPAIALQSLPGKDGKVYVSRVYQEALNFSIIGQLYSLLDTFSILSYAKHDTVFAVMPNDVILAPERLRWVYEQLGIVYH